VSVSDTVTTLSRRCNPPLPSSRHNLSNDDCLENKREDCQNCSLLYCVLQLCTVIRSDCYVFSLNLGLLFVCFCHFLPVSFHFVVLDLVSSVPSQEIG